MQDTNESDVGARATEYVDASKGIESADDAINGAVEILKERIAHDRVSRREIRDMLFASAELAAHPTAAAQGKRTKFESYYKYREKLASVPSHRFLALSRGSRRGMLRTELVFDESKLLDDLRAKYIKESGSPFAQYIERALTEALTESLRPQCEEQVMNRVRRGAEDHAIDVFCDNAHSVYLQPPAGAVSVLAIEAGVEDGCGIALVDENGTCALWEAAAGTEEEVRLATVTRVLALVGEHQPKALAVSANPMTRQIAIAIREAATDEQNLPYVVLVNGSGLSAYAGSEAANTEFLDIPKPARAAIALARRHQDPLKELSKIDPRAVGAGQYYQEINQKRLTEALGLVLESCVDDIGADVNTSDALWMSHVSGLRIESAESIVAHRKEHGAIDSLASLAEVRGVGPKVYEQCVGFLFINDGSQPLDRTRIHPNQYALVEKAAESAGIPVTELVGNADTIKGIDWSTFETEAGGPKSLADIQFELTHPGRDPRKPFRQSSVHGKLRSVGELKVGEQVHGIVTNITDFGAFVDVGTRQDGLVHLSELSHQYVNDPHRVVRLGQEVTVKITAVDVDAPRISLSMKAVQRGKPKDTRSQASHGASKQDAKRGESPRRPRKEKARKTGSRKAAPRKQEFQSGSKKEAPEQMNTQLADQLAALRDKLGTTE